MGVYVVEGMRDGSLRGAVNGDCRAPMIGALQVEALLREVEYTKQMEREVTRQEEALSLRMFAVS